LKQEEGLLNIKNRFSIKNKLFEVNNEFRHLYYYNKIETMPLGKSEIRRIWKIKI